MTDERSEGRRDGQPKSRKAPTFSKRGYNYLLMQVKSITERSWSILQYFIPSLSYHLSLKSLLRLFLRGSLRQVLLYISHLNEGVT